MPKVLILFAHPMLEKSNMQMRMVNAVKDLKKVFVHDLYEAYPDFNIDVAYEQELLLAHDVIVMQQLILLLFTVLAERWELILF